MSVVRIDLREWRVELPDVGPGSPGTIEVPVPAASDLIKDEPGTIVFAWDGPGPTRWVLKVYRRMARWNWIRKRLLGFRACREYRALLAMHAAGVRCSEPVFWGAGRSDEHGRYEVLATVEIPGGPALSRAGGSLDDGQREALLGPLFEDVARMHSVGVYHGSLYPVNLFLARDRDGLPEAAAILDLEKSMTFPGDLRGSRMAAFDLMNLTRMLACEGVGRAPLHRALGDYGLTPAAADAVLAAADAFESSKLHRNLPRAEFLLRARLAWTLRRLERTAIHAGAPPPSPPRAREAH